MFGERFVPTRTMNKILIAILIITGSIAIEWLILRSPKTSNMNNAEKKFTEQQNGEGNVDITAQPFVEGDAISFKIILNTHLVDLGQDFVQIAVLTDENGKTYKPTGWEGSPVGGHHREGILKFQLPDPSLKTFTLTLKNIGNVLERIFRWSIN